MGDKLNMCDNPNMPICRDYINKGKCHRNKHCKFYHPKVITVELKQKGKRELGHCYCGSLQKTIIGFKQQYKETNKATFFIVCSRTGKAMHKCIIT